MLIFASYEGGVIEVMIHLVGNGSFEKAVASCHWSFNFMDK